MFLQNLPHGLEGVVSIHDGVDEVVDHHEPSGKGGELAEAVEDEEHDSEMVPPGKIVNEFILHSGNLNVSLLESRLEKISCIDYFVLGEAKGNNSQWHLFV